MAHSSPRFCPQCGHLLTLASQQCEACHAPIDERFMLKNDPKVKQATDNLIASFAAPASRRAFFKKSAIITASGVAATALGAAIMPQLSSAAARQTSAQTQASLKAGLQQKNQSLHSYKGAQDPIVTILTVARTAEQLAVTFYSNGLANADKLGLKGDNLTYLQAALAEEQIHQQFFAANGGQSLTETFSFPHGPQTFTDLKTFIDTQQQLEGVFDSAFLAAIKEFAQLGRPDLAQIAGQVACIEAEHRALGRAIGGLSPADNWAFTPVYLGSVADAPALVTKAGYLSPKGDNSYMYKAVSTNVAGVEQTKPFAVNSSVVGNG
ncbi:ferritin-like domain-containing protein [Dictyobacter aurantiacus]|uniref:Ferritin-like domain-containing protein n=1 Tax=Dictyobacter aurantiacus TaxID=1936993 RepID=A0A401ZFP8_9CHLR|nr:ferritin-like domain-containing protein [Dictyobacter aurantiacus]GCE05679.1 hypothetical protein KDAU_30080 [Dictyobacter aurantiacus]